MENTDRQTEENLNLQLHPLLINHIVDKVLSFLDCTTLKVVRQVNHLWKDEGAKHLIETSYLKSNVKQDQSQPTDDSTNIIALTQLVSTSGSVQTVNLNVHINDVNVTDDSTTSPNGQLSSHLYLTNQNLFWLCSYGNRIKQLEYSGRNSKLLYKILMLDKLQNLQILITNSLNVTPAGFQHLDLSINEGQSESLVEKLQKIEIRLNYCLTSTSIIEFAAFQSFQNSKEVTKDCANFNYLNVKEIKFGWQFETVKEGLETYMSFSLPWKISRLKLHFYSNLPLELVRQFFQLISMTLEHVTIYLKIVQLSNENNLQEETMINFEKNIDEWFIPWSILNNVKTVEIAADKNCSNEFFRLKTMISALKLSNLKKLAVGEHIDEYLSKINGKVQSESLKEFEISLRGLHTTTSLFQAGLFPNLTRLLIHFHRDYFNNEAFKMQDEDQLKNFSFKPIFETLEKLERFEITYDDPNLDVWTETWNELVTGLKCPQNYSSNQLIDQLTQEQLKSSIRNLKCLKRFMFHDWSGSTINRLSDFVIYNGLSHLKTLQSIHIYGHDFSTEAVEYLKSQLRPNTSILIFSD